MLCMLPRLRCYYSARAWTLNMRDKRPEKQVARSSLLNKWHPQKLWHRSVQKELAQSLMYICILPVWVRGFSSSDPWAEMKLRKLMAFPELKKKKSETKKKRQTAGWYSWNTLGATGKSKWKVVASFENTHWNEWQLLKNLSVWGS